jgi:hypothetical protein
MSDVNRDRDEGWKYAEKAMNWYGWGPPIGLAVFVVSLGGFIALLHEAGLWR